MTNTQKLRTLLAILECAPAAHSMTAFESAVRKGDLLSFWAHYESALRTSKHDGKSKPDADGDITLAMLKPAMKVVYELPTTG